MDYRSIYYPEIRFGGFSDIDGTLRFYARLRALVEPGSIVLDVGCGRGERFFTQAAFIQDLCNFKGHVRRVIGIDVDANAQTNPSLDEFHLIEGPRWPVDDSSIDLAFCDFVLEHVSDPNSFFSEVRRVLKPGGYFGFRTPNAMGYVPLASRLIPSGLHKRVLKAAQPDRESRDVFPTVYRCNTRRSLVRLMQRYGLDSYIYRIEAEPAYFGFSRVAYGLAYYGHRVMPSVFRSTLIGFAIKSDAIAAR